MGSIRTDHCQEDLPSFVKCGKLNVAVSILASSIKQGLFPHCIIGGLDLALALALVRNWTPKAKHCLTFQSLEELEKQMAFSSPNAFSHRKRKRKNRITWARGRGGDTRLGEDFFF